MGGKCGTTAPKTVKISIFGHKFVAHGELFGQFLRNSQRVYASIGTFKAFSMVAFGDKQPSYKDFPAVGAFSHKFSVAPRGKTTDRIKKS